MSPADSNRIRKTDKRDPGAGENDQDDQEDHLAKDAQLGGTGVYYRYYFSP